MHTVIQWRERVICLDLPMNVPYLLDKVSISRTEIDAVIFTHNHDDHIGEFSMLLQQDKKVTISMKMDGENRSAVGVRVGAMGDTDLSVLLLTGIEKDLGLKPH